MGEIIERLQGLMGGGDSDAAEITPDTSGEVEQERAIDAVDAAREAAQVDAAFALTETPGGVDE